MLTWGQVLADLRNDMQESANPKLSEDNAYLYLRFALSDYSHWNPLILSTTLTLSGAGMASLPADFMSVIEVRSGGKLILPLGTNTSNPPTSVPAFGQWRWWTEAQNLRLTTYADPADGLSLIYRAQHTPPEDKDDTDAVMTFPDADEEPILLYIRAKAMGALRSKGSQLDRYKRRTQPGDRQDNPLEPEETNLMDEYLAIMRTRYGSVGTIRLGRQR